MGKKVTFSLFLQKLENGPFLAHFDKNGPKFGQNDKKWWFLAFFLENRTLEFPNFLHEA